MPRLLRVGEGVSMRRIRVDLVRLERLFELLIDVGTESLTLNQERSTFVMPHAIRICAYSFGNLKRKNTRMHIESDALQANHSAID